jgi:hypothetical protein
MLVGGSFVARAALGGANGVTLPYQGRLELNGQPVNGSVTFVLAVHNAATGGTACFTSPAINATVANGVFSLVVGSIPETCVKGRDVFVAVSVNQGAGLVALGGRQRVHPGIASLTSGPGDFHVAGRVDVGGVLVANGTEVHLGPVTNEQGTHVDWNRSGGGGESNFINHRGLGGGGFTFDNTNDGSALTRLLTLDASSTTIHNNTTINGTIRGASWGFGGMYSVETNLGNPGTACPNGVGLVFTASNNPVTAAQNCPGGFNNHLVSRTDFCKANVGTIRLDTYMCWK